MNNPEDDKDNQVEKPFEVLPPLKDEKPNEDASGQNEKKEPSNEVSNQNQKDKPNPKAPAKAKNVDKKKAPQKQAFNYEYEKIKEPELSNHICLLKQWIIKNNTFENFAQSVTKLRGLNMDDINIILNHKTNYARVKIYIDYLELSIKCPNFAIALDQNFTNYTKYLNHITRKILLTSRKIKEDTSIFTDFILLNYPFIYNQVSSYDEHQLSDMQSGIVSFSNCTVIKVNDPIFLLWSKKVYPSCNCGEFSKENPRRYFNYFTKSISCNKSFSLPIKCQFCGKQFYHEAKNDILIECQEIEILLNGCNPSLIQNKISVWCFGDLINSVHPGDKIIMNAFYSRERKFEFLKEFIYGNFIALNFNACFTPVGMLNPSKFVYQKSKDTDEKDESLNQRCPFSQMNNLSSLAENPNEPKKIKILNDLQFKKQFDNNFYKFLIQNYVQYEKQQINFLKNIDFNPEKENKLDIKNISPIVSDIYFPFLNIILELSICQRDYFNHTSKVDFLMDNNANYLIEIEKEKDPMENEEQQAFITKTRNLAFKTQCKKGGYNINQKEYNPNILLSNILKSNINFAKNPSDSNDFKKYFRLRRQINDGLKSKNSEDLLKYSFNLFLFFDNLQSDPLFSQMMKYATAMYKSSLIVIYPFFNQIQNKAMDKENLWNFLYQNNNKIVLIPDIDKLTKAETDIICSIMEKDRSKFSFKSMNEPNISITFWFCANSLRLFETSNKKGNNAIAIPQITTLGNKQLKVKGFEQIMKHCDIIINFVEKGIKMDNSIDVINEDNFPNLLNDVNSPMFSSETIFQLYSKFEKINSKIDVGCSENHYYLSNDVKNGASFDSAKYSASLIEEYFIKKRNISQLTFDDLESLLRISVLISMLRANYENRKIVLPSAISNINFFDAILSIIIYEETIGYKYGIEAKSFSNSNSKILFTNYFSDISKVLDGLEKAEKLANNMKMTGFEGNEVHTKISKMFNRRVANPSPISANVFAVADNAKKGFDICGLCKEINKIKNGKDNLLDFINQLSFFVNGKDANEYY